MKFRPLHDRVVVKRIDAEEKTAGGIIIPDTAKEKPSQGEITAVGPGGRDEAGKLIPIDLKVGDRVLFGKWARPASPRTASPSPRKSSLRTSSRTWAPRWCAKSHRSRLTLPATAPPQRPFWPPRSSRKAPSRLPPA